MRRNRTIEWGSVRLVGWLAGCVEREGEGGRFGSQCWLHVSVGCLCPSHLVGTRAGVGGEVRSVRRAGTDGTARQGKARKAKVRLDVGEG